MKPALVCALLAAGALQVDADLQKRVDEAIPRGRDFLKAALAKPLPEGQSAPLALHALLHAGLGPDDPLVASWLKTLPEAMKADRDRAYQAGILALLLSDLHDPDAKGRDFRRHLQELADALCRLQDRSGSWGYGAGFGDVGPQDANVSTAQYALLGLHAAAGRGARVPEAVWRKAAQYFLDDQQPPVKPGSYEAKPAGWAYGKTFTREMGDFNRKPYGAMTAVGVASLLLCAEHLPEKDPLQKRIRASVAAGLAWLGAHFSVKEHPGIAETWKEAGAPSDAFLFYYLYALERAGSFAGADRFGERAWYAEGARLLVDVQGKDGSWTGNPASPWPEEAVQATSFALLFLKRASQGVVKRSYDVGYEEGPSKPTESAPTTP